MAGEDGVYDLRDDSVLVADDTREERGIGLRGVAKFRNEVLSEFVFDAARETGCSEFAGAEGA